MALNKIRELLQNLRDSKYLIVDDFPGFENHKIGYAPAEKHLTLLIYSSNKKNTKYQKGGGKYLSISYDVPCDIRFNNKGIVKNILTKSSNHPHGIKVLLESGEVGRVKNIKA